MMTEEEQSAYMKKRGSCDSKTDPVSRLIRNSTAEEFVEWLVFRGSMDQMDDCVVSNLRDMFRHHRLQGRIDRSRFLRTLAKMWKIYQSPKTLESPHRLND